VKLFAYAAACNSRQFGREPRDSARTARLFT